MLFARPLAAAALAAAVIALAPRSAGAICAATEIIGSALEPACPSAGASCVVNRDYSVDNGCTLDFGSMALTINSHLTVGTHAVTLRAARITLGASAFLDAIGDAQGARGGLVHLVATGAGSGGTIDLAQTSRIDTGGNVSAGDVIFDSGGTVTVNGRIRSDFRNPEAAGGTIQINAGGDIVATAASILSARGGSDSDGGGEIDLYANGRVEVDSQLMIDGSDGGFIDIGGGTTAHVFDIDAGATGDAGSGGCIEVDGLNGTQVSGVIDADGSRGLDMTGGCGGLVQLDSENGDAVVDAAAHITANGTIPDGGGGQILITALRNVNIYGILEARGPGDDTCGGDLCADAGLDLTIAVTASLDASGGGDGGCIDLSGQRNVTLNGTMLADGNQPGSFGGEVSARAGGGGFGNLVVNALVDATSAPACSIENGCGDGGITDFSGCNVFVGAAAQLLTGAPSAGENDLTAREQLTILGKLDSVGTSRTPIDGINRFVYPARRPPILTGSTIAPAPLAQGLTTCPNQGNTNPPCLNPCPVCGNGVTEFPETCDPGLNPPLSCQANGCSVFCQIENCDDGMVCTDDSCNPDVGCRHTLVSKCTEPPTPTATVTNTRPSATVTQTSTMTASASATTTASATPTVTATALASATQTLSDTASPSPSRTGTSTASPTASSSPTASASPTPSNSATASPSASASATPTPTPIATSTATTLITPTDTAVPATATATAPACAGDCSGDGSVTVNELITGVNIALGNSAASVCPSFDRNGDGEVSIAELIAAVNAALTGC